LPSLPLRVDCSREIPVHSAHDVLEVIGIEPFGQHIARILGCEVAHSCFYALSCHRFFLWICRALNSR